MSITVSWASFIVSSFGCSNCYHHSPACLPWCINCY